MRAIEEAECILPETAMYPTPSPEYPQMDMHRKAFPNACRIGWQRGAPRPTVGTSAESRPSLDVVETVNHVVIARKLIAQLDEYEDHCQSYLEELEHEDFAFDEADEDVAMENENTAVEDDTIVTENEEVVNEDMEELDEWEGVVGIRENASDDQDAEFS